MCKWRDFCFQFDHFVISKLFVYLEGTQLKSPEKVAKRNKTLKKDFRIAVKLIKIKGNIMKSFLVVLFLVGLAAAQVDNNVNFIQRHKRVSR